MSTQIATVHSARRRRLSRPHCPRKAVARIETWIDNTRLASVEGTPTINHSRAAGTKRCCKSSFSRSNRRQRKISARQRRPVDKMVQEVHSEAEEPPPEEEPQLTSSRTEESPHPALILLIFGFAICTMLPLILLLLAFTTILHLAPLTNHEAADEKMQDSPPIAADDL
ncbi:hypothetical protein BKA70DRAFT_1435689 [Coprinopsis sp. MPI-PUGE-AT-0042]|nr:hypothetical protein BKA70DRAFT_1435689 [Coprinopsis sp. MPI-PUGE-AT-0042]